MTKLTLLTVCLIGAGFWTIVGGALVRSVTTCQVGALLLVAGVLLLILQPRGPQ